MVVTPGSGFLKWKPIVFSVKNGNGAERPPEFNFPVPELPSIGEKVQLM
jgi:hypothetical protein